jgi:hypothetical protein
MSLPFPLLPFSHYRHSAEDEMLHISPQFHVLHNQFCQLHPDAFNEEHEGLNYGLKFRVLKKNTKGSVSHHFPLLPPHSLQPQLMKSKKGFMKWRFGLCSTLPFVTTGRPPPSSPLLIDCQNGSSCVP